MFFLLVGMIEEEEEGLESEHFKDDAGGMLVFGGVNSGDGGGTGPCRTWIVKTSHSNGTPSSLIYVFSSQSERYNA